MIYDKQVPLTQEEFDYITSKENICLMNLPHYPRGNIHVHICWGLPIAITRNEDSFYWYEGTKECNNKENYWVVRVDEDAEHDFDFQTKQFKNIDDALQYGIKHYNNWLKGRIKLVEELIA